MSSGVTYVTLDDGQTVVCVGFDLPGVAKALRRLAAAGVNLAKLATDSVRATQTAEDALEELRRKVQKLRGTRTDPEKPKFLYRNFGSDVHRLGRRNQRGRLPVMPPQKIKFGVWQRCRVK